MLNAHVTFLLSFYKVCPQGLFKFGNNPMLKRESNIPGAIKNVDYN
jgi:hypothetical protein